MSRCQFLVFESWRTAVRSTAVARCRARRAEELSLGDTNVSYDKDGQSSRNEHRSRAYGRNTRRSQLVVLMVLQLYSKRPSWLFFKKLPSATPLMSRRWVSLLGDVGGRKQRRCTHVVAQDGEGRPLTDWRGEGHFNGGRWGVGRDRLIFYTRSSIKHNRLE